MPIAPLKIAVIGCGSGGPAAACLLSRQGHQVEIFEQAPSKLPVGAGFMLQPSGMEVLKELGCLNTALSKTDIIHQLYCKTSHGKVLLDLHYAEVSEHLFGAGTQRAAFLDVLLEQCVKDQVKVHWDSPVTTITHKGKQKIISHQNTEYGAFDLIIIADGARSSLRDQLDIPSRVNVYPWGALWFIGRRTENFASDTLWQVVDSTHTLNGFLPTGTENHLLSFFYSLKLSELEKWQQTNLEQWKQNILDSTPEAASFLEQIHSHEQLQVARYHDVKMPYWHTQGAVIIGDAAHALSPQLGQGVNLALIDALHLAENFKQANELDEALTHYSQSRKKHLQFYQLATRSLTPFFQSNYEFLGTLRDLSFPLATKFSWIRKQMTLSMAGYKNGLLSAEKIKL